MKHVRLFHLAVFLLGSTLTATSQQIVGNVNSLVEQLKNQKTSANLREDDITPITFQIEDKTLSILTTALYLGDTSEVFSGKIANEPYASFRFSARENQIRGFISLPKRKLAYAISSNERHELIASPTDINRIICIEYTGAEPEVAEALQAVPPSTSTVFTLQSFPSATATAYLDFDGETVSGTQWASGATINAVPGNFSETDIRNIFNLVSEDYRGFNINITTDINIYNKAPKNRRMRCIFTPTNTASPGAGGVAYIGSFTWGNETPCWVFNSGAKNAGEAASHEIGHTLNLRHDGRTSPSEDYFTGQGNWCPIMGAGYSKSVVQWSKGEYANANNTEDDISIITTRNGFGFRTDDYGNTIATATSLTVGTGGTVVATSNSGVIMNRTDVDVFKFTTGGGNISLTISPAATYADLDIFAAILNSNGDTLNKYNPTTLSCTVSTNLTAGTYYLSIDGVGAGLPTSTGYSDYASIGAYSISGSIPQGSNNNILPNLAITSPLNNAIIEGPSTIVIMATATDPDGSIKLVEFFNGTTKLGEDATAPYTFSWPDVAVGTYTLTAKATDNLDGTSISSAIAITVTKGACKVADSLVRYKAIIGTSGSYNNSGRTRETAFDKDVSTYFDAPIGNGSFVGLELQSAYKITGIRYYPRATYMSRMAGGKFQGSNSANFSTGVVDLATVSATPPTGWNCLTVSNNNTFRYVRYLGPNGSYCNVSEIEYYGVPTISTDLEEGHKSSTVWVYPNPGQDYLTIETINIPLQAELIDAKGSSIAQYQLVSYEQRLDVSTFPKGIYFLKLQNESFSKTVKVALK